MQIPAGLIADRSVRAGCSSSALAASACSRLLFSLQSDYVGLVANQALTGFFRALVFTPACC